MRSQPSISKKEPSPGQVNQHLKLRVVMKFIQSMSGLFMISFRNYAVKMTGINSAFSYNIKNAVTGVSPNYSVDYSMALISRGGLPNATNPTATAAAGGIINFAWADNTSIANAEATYKAILVVFCEDFHQTLYTTGSAARSAATDSMDATIFAGKTVQTYIGFISEDGREIATSVYTGQLVVTP